MPINVPDIEGPIRVPRRPKPVLQLQTARMRDDGSIETEGPERIGTNEHIPSKKRWTSLVGCSVEQKRHEIERAIQRLRALASPSIIDKVSDLPKRWVWGIRREDSSELWLLVHAPRAPLRELGHAIADALFGDTNALIFADCSLAENSNYHLFGTPPGYRGCLEGGVITNHLKIRPESLVILSNFEFADEGTLNAIHNFARNGECGPLVARGAEVCRVSGRDAVFVLATTRAFSKMKNASKKALLKSFKTGRSDIDWQYLYSIRGAPLLIWNMS